jgi:fumarylacetoacetate (FAA) hydrolase
MSTGADDLAVRLVSRAAPGRDGALGVVSSDLARVLPGPVPTLQALLEGWSESGGALAELAAGVETGEPAGSLADAELLAPLPRAVQYCEGSTYLSHMRRCRAARGAQLPADVLRAPAVLQGSSDRFLAPTEPIGLADERWELDLECTLTAVLDDVPQGVSASAAGSQIRLFMLANDLTLRAVLRDEVAMGVGFFGAKPLRVFAPVAVSPAVLGDAWDGQLVSLQVSAWINGERLGCLDSGSDAAFSFPEVIAHAARTRPLAAGTIVGTGTISNEDPAAGFGALAEKRAMQILAGQPPSPYLRPGDVVAIDARDASGQTVFGTMENKIITIEESTT